MLLGAQTAVGLPRYDWVSVSPAHSIQEET